MKASSLIKINKKYLPILVVRPPPDKPSELAWPPNTKIWVIANMMVGRQPDECENIAMGEETSRPLPPAPPALLSRSSEQMWFDLMMSYSSLGVILYCFYLVFYYVTSSNSGSLVLDYNNIVDSALVTNLTSCCDKMMSNRMIKLNL